MSSVDSKLPKDNPVFEDPDIIGTGANIRNETQPIPPFAASGLNETAVAGGLEPDLSDWASLADTYFWRGGMPSFLGTGIVMPDAADAKEVFWVDPNWGTSGAEGDCLADCVGVGVCAGGAGRLSWDPEFFATTLAAQVISQRRFESVGMLKWVGCRFVSGSRVRWSLECISGLLRILLYSHSNNSNKPTISFATITWEIKKDAKQAERDSHRRVPHVLEDQTVQLLPKQLPQIQIDLDLWIRSVDLRVSCLKRVQKAYRFGCEKCRDTGPMASAMASAVFNSEHVVKGKPWDSLKKPRVSHQ